MCCEGHLLQKPDVLKNAGWSIVDPRANHLVDNEREDIKRGELNAMRRWSVDFFMLENNCLKSTYLVVSENGLDLGRINNLGFEVDSFQCERARKNRVQDQRGVAT